MDESEIIEKLMEYDERLEKIKRKLDDVVTKDAFNAMLDQVMVILNRLDPEYIFT